MEFSLISQINYATAKENHPNRWEVDGDNKNAIKIIAAIKINDFSCIKDSHNNL